MERLNTSLFVKLNNYPSEAQILEVCRVLGVTPGEVVLNIHKAPKTEREKNLSKTQANLTKSRHKIY